MANQEQKNSIFAKLSLVFSIVGIFGVFLSVFLYIMKLIYSMNGIAFMPRNGIVLLLSIFLILLSPIFGIVAKKQISKNENITGNGIANAGIIISSLFILTVITITAFVKLNDSGPWPEIDEPEYTYTSEHECELFVDFDIKEIAGISRICYNITSNKLNLTFTIENHAKRIEGLRVIAIGYDDSIYITNLSFGVEKITIEKGQTLRNSAIFEVKEGFDLAQVEFIPKINTTNKDNFLCMKRTLVRTNIPKC